MVKPNSNSAIDNLQAALQDLADVLGDKKNAPYLFVVFGEKDRYLSNSSPALIKVAITKAIQKLSELEKK